MLESPRQNGVMALTVPGKVQVEESNTVIHCETSTGKHNTYSFNVVLPLKQDSYLEGAEHSN